MKTKLTLIFVTLLLTIGLQAQIRYLKANLQGTQEVPANGSSATGITIIRYNTTNKFLELWGDYQGLTATATASHIHSPGPAGTNASVLITLAHTGGTTGNITGTATLTAAQETDLFAGNMYVNIHNASFPGGEIRGQISNTTNGQTELFNARLQGAQENPPNGSTASGYANILLDKTQDSVFITGGFTGLTAAASASHIHTGAANVNGPVKINLVVSAATSGTVHIAAPILAADETEMLNGNTYVNIHNATFPGGEIRGQVNQFSQMRFFRATLQASQEVPPNASTATGIAVVKYNTTTRFLELTGDYQNTTAAVNNSHIHSPAAPGSNASVLITITNTGGTSGTLTGTATLTQAQETDLFNGMMYVNVHTTANPGGEIRGQLGSASSGETLFFNENLQGTQEVPSNSSTASGSVNVILDKLTNTVYLTGLFTGLTAPATAAHIHQERAGVNGSVVVTLNVTNATSGTVNGTATVSPAFAAEMANGNTYVNIHNSSFSGGEIRGQLANLVLPVKLSYFNGYKNQQQVTLVWESAQEINVSRYEVEQQNIVTGKWMNKANVVARGGTVVTNYKYTDAPLNFSSPYVFYRLKMIDKDGKFNYSQVIKINFSKSKAELSILVNPVLRDELRFTITGIAADKKLMASVVDYNGRTVISRVTSSLTNNVLQVGTLAKGMYKLVIRVDDTLLEQSFIK